MSVFGRWKENSVEEVHFEGSERKQCRGGGFLTVWKRNGVED